MSQHAGLAVHDNGATACRHERIGAKKLGGGAPNQVWTLHKFPPQQI
jgi:hypothetical protein